MKKPQRDINGAIARKIKVVVRCESDRWGIARMIKGLQTKDQETVLRLGAASEQLLFYVAEEPISKDQSSVAMNVLAATSQLSLLSLLRF